MSVIKWNGVSEPPSLYFCVCVCVVSEDWAVYGIIMKDQTRASGSSATTQLQLTFYSKIY